MVCNIPVVVSKFKFQTHDYFVFRKLQLTKRTNIMCFYHVPVYLFFLYRLSSYIVGLFKFRQKVVCGANKHIEMKIAQEISAQQQLTVFLCVNWTQKSTLVFDVNEMLIIRFYIKSKQDSIVLNHHNFEV